MFWGLVPPGLADAWGCFVYILTLCLLMFPPDDHPWGGLVIAVIALNSLIFFLIYNVIFWVKTTHLAKSKEN